jgi:hypothetical protein
MNDGGDTAIDGETNRMDEKGDEKAGDAELDKDLDRAWYDDDEGMGHGEHHDVFGDYDSGKAETKEKAYQKRLTRYGLVRFPNPGTHCLPTKRLTLLFFCNQARRPADDPGAE